MTKLTDRFSDVFSFENMDVTVELEVETDHEKYDQEALDVLHEFKDAVKMRRDQLLEDDDD